jgi:multiple sugar transport system substrate-binding protein
MNAAKDPVLMADPNWQFFVDAMNTSTSGVFVTGYPNWQEQLSQRYESIWTGELAAEQAVQEAQQVVDDTIATNVP